MISSYAERPWQEFYANKIPLEIDRTHSTVVEALAWAAEEWQNKTALLFYGKKITYKELMDKVDRFATALSGLGVQKGDRVSMLMLNTPEFIIAFYGIIKIGAVAVSISPVYVSQEIEYQLEDSGSDIIICQDILYEALDKTGKRMKNTILTNVAESLPKYKRMMGKSILKGLYQKMAIPATEIYGREGVYGFQDLLKSNQPDPPKVEINSADIISLQYTGGTTGPPKGVMTSHENMTATFEQFKAFYSFKDGEETLVGYMPFYHTGGLFLGPLFSICHGHTLIVMTTSDTDEILNAITRYGVTTFFGAPAIYEILNDYDKTERVDWKELKLCVSTADVLYEATAKNWQRRTGITLNDFWAASETSFSLANPPWGVKKGSVGIPVSGTVAVILDPDKDEVLVPGEVGELAINGAQVTSGYWNKPEATRDCEAKIDGIRWWRTGDLAWRDEEGYFFIYDRKRDLIKYKGLRVFAREVEEVLKGHPQIKDVGVIGAPDIKVGENVKAFVVLESDARGNLSESDIMEYCKDHLASYKVPRIVEFVGEIPKTDVGKVSRRELREEEE